MNIVKFLLNIVRQCKYWFILSSVLALIPSSLSAVGHIYYAQIISSLGNFTTETFSPALIKCLIFLAIIYAAQDIVEGLRVYVDTPVKIRYQRAMHNTLFNHNHHHSANFYNTEQTGLILAKTSNLSQGTFQIFGNLRAFIFPHTSFFITTAALLYTVSWQLCAVLITLNIIETILTYFLYKKLKQYAKTSAKEESKAAGLLVDSIANARLVKNTATIYHEKRAFRNKMNAWIRAQITENKVGGLSNLQNTLLATFFMVTNLSIIIAFFYYQNLTLENVILAITLIFRLEGHSYDIAHLFDSMQSRLGSMNDALEFLYHKEEVTDIPNAKSLKVKTNTVEFKNASFSYKDDKPLFDKLNLMIKPNEKVGLVGISGSGNSTLINIILRAFDLKSGKVLISGQDISKVTQYSLHQNIALISQEPCLFNRSIMENIRFAKPKATDEEVYHAAKLAHIHDTIIKMPNGYNSVVGERGVKLSGGERQRIAIAAAILKDTPILILDEATSALDSESEQAIEKALKNIMKNKTVIAIAHRLSTLKNMDKIVVLDKGKIVERGTQKELLQNKSGIFSRLYKLQSDGYLQN